MIDVFCADISKMEEADYQRLLAGASPQRRERAGRYLKWEDRLRCVVADGLIRYGAHRALGLSEFTVAQDAMGKPYIQGHEEFCFNLSHSGKWVVMACGDTPVGVDVQQLRKNPQREQKICGLFAEDEAAYILAGEEGNRFWRIWTAKESYLKYLGVGLRKALNSFSVLQLDVEFYSEFFEDYCMTVCASGKIGEILRLDARELM